MNTGGGNKLSSSRRKVPMVPSSYKTPFDGQQKSAAGTRPATESTSTRNRKELGFSSQGGHMTRFPLPSKNRTKSKGGRRKSGNPQARFVQNPKKPYPKKPGGHRLVPQDGADTNP